MSLSAELINEFAKVTYDQSPRKRDSSVYGIAVIQNGVNYVRIDGADVLTPATYTVKVRDGDRVLITLKDRKALVTANITHPTMLIGTLYASDGIIVQGHMTTNEDRTTYNDLNHAGLTFDGTGIGGSDGQGQNGNHWYMTNSGSLFANSAEIAGIITAKSGWLGDNDIGFKIDQYGIYSGTKKELPTSGFIVLSNSNFSRPIAGFTGSAAPTDLRFAIGANFGVSESGVLYSKDGNFSGRVTAISGYLGNGASGFFIDSTSIYTGAATGETAAQAKSKTSSGYITLSNADFTRSINDISRTGLRFAIGANFGVTNNGILYAAGVDISGTIKASNGSIGNFTIKDGKLYTGNHSAYNSNADGVYIGSDYIALGQNGKFKVSATGVLTATGADIGGKITAGADSKIGPWNVTTASIWYGNATHGNASGLYFGTSGLSVKDKFVVNASGVLTAKGATIDGKITAGADSKIGPWNVTTASIWYGNATHGNASGLYFGTSGLSVKDKFVVDKNGICTVSGGFLIVKNTNTSSGSAGLSIYQQTVETGRLFYDPVGQNIFLSSVKNISLEATWELKLRGASQSSGSFSSMSLSSSGIGMTAPSGQDYIWVRDSGITINSLSTASHKITVNGRADFTGTLYFQDYSDTLRMPVASVSGDGGRVAFLQMTSATQCRMYSQNGTAGSEYAYRTWTVTASSDIRLKENIGAVEVDALGTLNKISLHSFDWKENHDRWAIGMIADEIEKIDPKFTTGGGYEDGVMNIKSIDTFYMLGYIIGAIQELSAENRSLKAEIHRMKGANL